MVACWAGRVAVPRETIGAAVGSSIDGALACVRRNGDVRLVAVVDDRPSESPDVVARLVAAAHGAEIDIGTAELAREAERLRGWLARAGTSDVLELSVGHVARSRQRLLRRVNAIAHRSRRHERGRVGAMLMTARSIATATLSAGAERVLDRLAQAEMPDVAWLTSLGEFAALHARERTGEPDDLLALIVLRHV